MFDAPTGAGSHDHPHKQVPEKSSPVRVQALKHVEDMEANTLAPLNSKQRVHLGVLDCNTGCLSFHPMAQCVVHGLKGLASSHSG
jgi:hypothetical protein